MSRDLYKTAIVAVAAGIVVSVAAVAWLPPTVDLTLLPWALIVWAVASIAVVVCLLAWTAARARAASADARHARMVAAQARFEADTAIAERQAALELNRVAQEQIGRVSRERLRLLNELSHQLRTPLQAVLGWCDIVRMQAPDNPTILAGLEVIRRNAVEQARIIAEILGDGRTTVELLPQVETVTDTLGGLMVLVVEDQDDSREFLSRAIGEAGGRVVVAATAEEGLDALEAHRPDLIVSDLGLPGTDGLAFVQSARARGFTDVPALALTGYTQADTRRRALEAGFQAHAGKPVNAPELIALLSAMDPRRRLSAG